MTTILDTLKNTADEEKAATALAAFARENPEALETIIKANQLFLEKFAPSGGENLYNAYRETARAYKKKNLIQSNYPYDSQNYAEAAAYYLKAAERLRMRGGNSVLWTARLQCTGIWMTKSNGAG